jgi:putative DNA primase/helicase
LPGDVAGEVLRFHPACPWRDEEADRIIQVLAMLAAMRSIIPDQITAVHRTRLTPDGNKIGRRMLGIAAGAAIEIDGDDTVSMGLTIGEGIETALAARQLGLRPVWALGSVGGIAKFPVLSGIDALTILAERQDDGTPNAASERAVIECGRRWHEAGREVVVIDPPSGDVNDALQMGKVA